MSTVLIVTLCLGVVPMGFLLMAAFIGLGLRLLWGDKPPAMFPWHIFGGEPAPMETKDVLDDWAGWWVRKGTWISVFWLILLLSVLASGI